MTVLTTSIPANFSLETMDENQNSTDDIKCHYDIPEWNFTVYFLIISVLGIFLNVFVLMVFWLHKKACTVAEIYLSNLAAADLLLMSLFPIRAVITATKYDWQNSKTLCKLFSFSFCMNSDYSLYILALVSIDRYLALVHPLTKGRMRRPFYAKLACLVVWGLCFLLNVHELIYVDSIHDREGNFSTCDVNDPIPTVYLVFRGIEEFCCIIPIFIISFCTFKIIHALRKRFMKTNTQEKEQKATTLILVVVLAFLICWVPTRVVWILDMFFTLNILNGCSFLNYLYICQKIFSCLALFNGVLNPILYVIVGKNFQTKVKKNFLQISTNLSQSLSTEDSSS